MLEQLAYGYDKAGNRVRVITGSAHTNYPANNLNQTTSEQGFGPTKFSGTLDEPALVTVNGQTAKVTSDGGNAPYTFEALVDLAEGDNTVTIEATDGSSNTTTQSYSVITDGVGKTLEYDLNGNLRYEKDDQGTVLKEFQWDSKNRLLAIQDAAEGSEVNGTKRSEFEYDGFDRRVQIVEKTYDGTAWITDSGNVFIWNRSQILQKRDSAGSMVVRSYFAVGFEETGVDYYYTKDHLGSIREVVASDGATIEAVYDYSPWGEVAKISGTGVESDFLYTGHFYHEPSDLHLTHFRAYDPTQGRWLSRDPIESIYGIPAEFLPEGPNLYGYVGNNPINYIDPTGEFAFAIPVVYGVGIAAAAVVAWVAADLLEEPLRNAADSMQRCVENVYDSVFDVPEDGSIIYGGDGGLLPAPAGGSITGSPDGEWIQVRDPAGNPTGDRIDGGHPPTTHPDPRAQGPHVHRPGVENPDGTPWLPVN